MTTNVCIWTRQTSSTRPVLEWKRMLATLRRGRDGLRMQMHACRCVCVCVRAVWLKVRALCTCLPLLPTEQRETRLVMRGNFQFSLPIRDDWLKWVNLKEIPINPAESCRPNRLPMDLHNSRFLIQKPVLEMISSSIFGSKPDSWI